MKTPNIPGVSMLQSRLLSANREIVHGFTTKALRSTTLASKDRSKLSKLADFLKLEPSFLVGFEQVHGEKVVRVIKEHAGRVILAVDGGITTEKRLVLAVKTADCLPVLLYGPEHIAVAAVHAGWHGILKGIVDHAIDGLRKLGNKVKSIRMIVGPHIGGCCYRVSSDRAKRFVDLLGTDPLMVYSQTGRIHLDLGRAVYNQALNNGLNPSHIEVMLNCTSCQNRQFYSFRREGKDLAGEMFGFIGIR